MKNKIQLVFLIAFISIFSSFWFSTQSKAEANDIVPVNELSTNLDQNAITKDNNLSAFDNKIKLSFASNTLEEATDVKINLLDEPIEMPWQLKKLSPIYQFDILNKNSYTKNKPFTIQIFYNEKNNDLKKVYFFDKNLKTWRPLPTKDNPKEKFVQATLNLSYARIAVFSFPRVLTVGKASWYAYKKGLFAASPDFPIGSVLRVYNADNNKFVDVTVNDWGPERLKHPDRVVDLDKVAFAKISSLGAGVINVRVEPLKIATNTDGEELEIGKDGASTKLSINSKAAIAMNEKTGEILWQKNATSSMPLASLTKLIAVKVFLDTKPDLKKKIVYSKKDEEYNYKYCKPWESSKIKLNDGDIVTYENLIYGSLIGSANNTIETIVRASGLKRDAFIKKMNESVTSWGASSTRFIEPSGLSPENVSSASDYAIILKEVMSNPIIQKASTMTRYDFTTINTKKKFYVYNTNKIIGTNNLTFTGSKTGYLDEAGYCLATRVKTDNNNVIVVTLGADTRKNSFAETIDLIKYAILNI